MPNPIVITPNNSILAFAKNISNMHCFVNSFLSASISTTTADPKLPFKFVWSTAAMRDKTVSQTLKDLEKVKDETQSIVEIEISHSGTSSNTYSSNFLCHLKNIVRPIIKKVVPIMSFAFCAKYLSNALNRATKLLVP